MEMYVSIRSADKQAAFMLAALREIRADGRELKKKREETESQQAGVILGNLLGPAIKADKGPAVQPPGFELPPNLEFVGLELDLPVGFQRLRWALLNNESTFTVDALWKEEAKYENIEVGKWSKNDEHIGLPFLAPGVNQDDFVGAEKEAQFLMPKSAFVSANMCFESGTILVYNDYCFCLKKRGKFHNQDNSQSSYLFAMLQPRIRTFRLAPRSLLGRSIFWSKLVQEAVD
jgi:hypothetical protein